MSVSCLRICRGSHLKLEHISILPHGVLQPASSAFLCCTLSDETCLMKFPSHPFPSSNPPFQSWVFPPPGSLPMPTAQVFLDVLLHITHFFSRSFPSSSLPSPLCQLICSGLEDSLCSTSPFVPHPHPSLGGSQPALSQGLSASCSFQRAIPFDTILSKITSLPYSPPSFRASPRLT